PWNAARNCDVAPSTSGKPAAGPKLPVHWLPENASGNGFHVLSAVSKYSSSMSPASAVLPSTIVNSARTFSAALPVVCHANADFFASASGSGSSVTTPTGAGPSGWIAAVAPVTT